MNTSGSGRFLGGYQLIRPLGKGGQGQVWLAIAKAPPGEQVALKVTQTRSPSQVARALREAQLLSNLRHPGLVRLLGVLEDPEVGLVLVMELASGASLDTFLSAPRLSTAHREAIAVQVASALAYLHERRVLHRDVKPENVMLSESFWENPLAPGGVKLVDLGISTEVGNPSPLTGDGRVIGTASAMAPERIAPTGFQADAVDSAASDVFSWGVLAWGLLVGGHPTGLPVDAPLPEFAVAYMAKMQGQGSWPARPVDHPWAPLLARCLALAPHQRPADAGEILAWLSSNRGSARASSFTEDSPPLAARPPQPPRAASVERAPGPPAPARGRNVVAIALALAASLGLLLAAWGAWNLGGWRRQPAACSCNASKTLGPCASGRTTSGSFACGDSLPRGQRFRFRLSFVSVRGKEPSLAKQDPDARLRLCTRSAPVRCQEFVMRDVVGNQCSARSPFEVSVSDLTEEGLDAWVFSSRGVLLDTQLLRHDPPLMARGVLCEGLLFAWSNPREGKLHKIGAFLDD